MAASGNHTAPDGPDLIDAVADFIVGGVLIGHTVNNDTDGSTAVITALTAMTIIAPLSGGGDNTWSTGDAFTTLP